MKFRVKHIPGVGYFPQVRTITGAWRRIGVHTFGYGLYEDDSHPYGTEERATEVCKDYKVFREKYKVTPTYKEVSI